MRRLEQEARRAVLPNGQPLLAVVIDTEEEFEWSRGFSRLNRAVTSIAAQHRAQLVFKRYGAVPTYVVDYPVATDPQAVEILKDWLQRGECRIGAHLHPWVNPPDDEDVTAFNSYAGNLPPALERDKLSRLTDVIDAEFGTRPVVYRAGRYGIGPRTAGILQDLGYLVDTSVVPYISYREDGGPCFQQFSAWPYWFGDNHSLLELPLTCSLTGLMHRFGGGIFAVAGRPSMSRLRAKGVLARLGLLERISLSPESGKLEDHQRLTRTLLRDGCNVFCYSYHSPSLAPGNTPYVRTLEELQRFLDRIEGYLEFFVTKLGGRVVTLEELYYLLQSINTSRETATPQ